MTPAYSRQLKNRMLPIEGQQWKSENKTLADLELPFFPVKDSYLTEACTSTRQECICRCRILFVRNCDYDIAFRGYEFKSLDLIRSEGDAFEIAFDLKKLCIALILSEIEDCDDRRIAISLD